MKIAILGYSGCGKSTLAKTCAECYDIPVLHLDRVQFVAGWKERDRAEAMAIVKQFMEQESWVIDGNYTAFHQAERLRQADLIVYMAFNRFSCLWRAWKRYRKYRGMERDCMAEGCVEKMDAEFVWWILYGGRTREKQKYYRNILQQYQDKSVVIRNQRQLDRFAKKVAAKGRLEAFEKNKEI